MTDEEARRRDWAIRSGGIGARLREVQRMLGILEHQEARIRPNAAWALLPLGVELGEAVDLLRELPMEGEEPDMLERIAEMKTRERLLQAQHRAHAAQEHETREPWELPRH